MRTRHPLAVLVVGVALALLAGCSSGTGDPAASPAPPSSSGTPALPTTTTAPPGPDLTGTRVLSPRRGLFTVNVPTRYADVDAGSPAATAVPALAQALQRGVGVLAVDRRDGYSPTVGGFCTLVQARDLPQLLTEARDAILRSGSPVAPPAYTVLPARGPAGPRVSGTYRTASGGRTLDVQQVAGLAGPGRACLLTVSTDDAVRDAAVLTTARDTFRTAG